MAKAKLMKSTNSLRKNLSGEVKDMILHNNDWFYVRCFVFVVFVVVVIATSFFFLTSLTAITNELEVSLCA